MKVDLTADIARFSDTEVPAGVYVLGDSYKPYLHPLQTPAGHCMTMAMPGDHRHHKGLMYALRCADLNFWEESPEADDCGIQVSEEISAEGNTLRQQLLWQRQDGELKTYRELRTIACRRSSDGRSYVWTWKSRREALRDHRLVASDWAMKKADGTRVNYHGLGIRPPWMWRFSGELFNGIERDGRPATADEVSGNGAQTVRWWGTIDGYRDPPRCAITMTQKMGYAWFALKEDFPYLSTGPSILDDISVRKGFVFDETYQIRVEDLQ
ncbi:MAG: PmoA family protein [Opitutales bacterium]|nr:PmoA family protein [Opitutales bacterium]